jgi:hypothetical protein
MVFNDNTWENVGRGFIRERSQIVYRDDVESAVVLKQKLHVISQANNDEDDCADLIPFLNCTINDGTTCTAVWGFSNTHAVQLTFPLFNNEFTPSPFYLFGAYTLVYRAFNSSRHPVHRATLVGL